MSEWRGLSFLSSMLRLSSAQGNGRKDYLHDRCMEVVVYELVTCSEESDNDNAECAITCRVPDARVNRTHKTVNNPMA
jgi:hypothetical protein